tara:strand:- start:344 stop:1255 length:912 start_codon:yes stop_codon:yes gene_type:complete
MLPITILTPTFNRQHTLRRVYESLLNQDFQLFEWLIIDDGSTDLTGNLIQELKKSSPFQIRYKYQSNGGKHRAHNTGVQLAKGILTTILDSDDELIKDAVEMIWKSWKSIPKGERSLYCGIWGNSVNQNGVKIGTEIKSPFIDGKLFDLTQKKIIIGEKLPSFRTEILKKHPFPTKINCNEYVPEGVVWIEISEEYKMRFLSDSLRIYYQDIEDEKTIMNIVKNDNYGYFGKLMFSIKILNIVKNYFPKYILIFSKHIIRFIILIKESEYSLFKYLTLIENKVVRTLIIIIYPASSLFLRLFR